MLRSILFLALGGACAACSLVTVEQEPFPPMQIKAKRPGPPPPRVVLTASSIAIADKIQFKLGSAELLPESHGLLDEVARVFQDNPQIELVQIEGHTDITGSAAVNRKLSKQRAEAVRAYLIRQGIPGTRMLAMGFGPDRPIADNGTPEGQEKNRRVEFNIVKQGPKKTVIQEE
jgi:outer membrane protein OmpA-like peptidoglycan-associated protein